MKETETKLTINGKLLSLLRLYFQFIL